MCTFRMPFILAERRQNQLSLLSLGDSRFIQAPASSPKLRGNDYLIGTINFSSDTSPAPPPCC